MKSIFIFLLFSCSVPFKRPKNSVNDTIVLEDELIESSEELREGERYAHELKPPVLGIERLHLFLDSLKD